MSTTDVPNQTHNQLSIHIHAWIKGILALLY